MQIYTPSLRRRIRNRFLSIVNRFKRSPAPKKTKLFQSLPIKTKPLPEKIIKKAPRPGGQNISSALFVKPKSAKMDNFSHSSPEPQPKPASRAEKPQEKIKLDLTKKGRKIPKTTEVMIVTYILSFAIISIIFLGIYLSTKGNIIRYNPKNYFSKNLSGPITTTATPTPEPVSNWKTYTNEDIGFELKYPSAWNNPGEYIEPPKTEVSFEDFNLFVINGLNFDQTLKRTLNYYEEIAKEEEQAEELKDITVAGIETTKFIKKTEESTYTEVVIIPSNDGKTIYWISMVLSKDTDSALFDQILATFRFINEIEEFSPTPFPTITSNSSL